MKEFIEKLIERLEEEKSNVPVNRILDDIINDKPKELGQLMAYSKAIKIANELAEEYNQENDDTDYANIELYAFWKKHQWIPCSERLPENISTVLVQVKEFESPTIGWYGNMVGWRLSEKDLDELNDFTVIAWQPLPVPYQPKGE